MQTHVNTSRHRSPAGRRPRGRSIVPLVIAALLLGCDRDSQPSTAARGPAEPAAPAAPQGAPAAQPAAQSTATVKGPVLQFEKTRHDFGETSDAGVSLSCAFKFTNTGTETLVIDRVKTNCGCTVPSLDKKRFEPGEGDSIRVSFKPPRSGYQTQEITVLSNSVDQAVTRVKIAANVTQFVELDPPILRFGLVEFGEEHRTTFVVKCADPKAKLDRIETTSPYVMARPAENAIAAQMPPGHFLIDVVVDDRLPWGPYQGRLTTYVRGTPKHLQNTILHDAPIRVDISAYGQVIATPATFRMGAAPGSEFERVIKLTHRDGKPFRIRETEVRKGSLKEMSVRWEPFEEQGERGCKLILTGKADAPEEAHIRGRVAFTTDLPGEPEREIKIVGVVRTPQN
jgi:hypothetical protein